MNRFLLFVDKYLYDHDYLVTDFIKSFSSLSEAQEFYDAELRETSYGALVAEYDGINLVVRCRTPEDWRDIPESGWVLYDESPSG